MKRGFALACLAVSLCGVSFAENTAVSRADIEHWLAVWRSREGIEHWNIDLRIVGQSEMPRNIIGDVEWWETPGTARIRLVGSDDLERFYHHTPAEARFDVECTVIHELMHLVLSQLYDDGSGAGDRWLKSVRGGSARMEAITENLAVMLINRRVPGGVSLARYVNGQINSGPWKPAPDVKERVVLQIVRAMNAASEDDVMALYARR